MLNQTKVVQQQATVEGEMLRFGRCLCGKCQKKGKVGSTIRPDPNKAIVRILCKDCTIENLAENNGLSIKDASKKLERQHKAQEVLAKVIIERYQAETGKKIPKNLQAIAEVVQPGMTWWNDLLSDSEKTKIEDMSKDEQKAFFATAPILPKTHEPIVNEHHTGRNDPCRCGSGKKFKRCCLEKQAA